MKKLMIAAAAAAMIGGVEAAKVAEYDFVANLTTTAGQTAPDSVVGSTTYNFGKNTEVFTPTTLFWYEDARFTVGGAWKKLGQTFTNATFEVTYNGPDITKIDWVSKEAKENAGYADLAWTQHNVGGTQVPALVNVSPDGALWGPDLALVTALAATYKYESAGQWCCSVTVKTVGGGCYRTRGANRIATKLYLRQDCCTGTTNAFVDIKGQQVVNYSMGSSVKFDPNDATKNLSAFLQHFGSISDASSTLIEMYAQVKNVYTSGYKTPLPFGGYAAGQGSWQTVKVDGADVRVPTSINGSIVGMTTASLCDYCCKRPDYTDAWSCLDVDVLGSAWLWQPNTAAFGTFYLQYRGIKDTTKDLDVPAGSKL